MINVIHRIFEICMSAAFGAVLGIAICDLIHGDKFHDWFYNQKNK